MLGQPTDFHIKGFESQVVGKNSFLSVHRIGVVD